MRGKAFIILALGAAGGTLAAREPIPDSKPDPASPQPSPAWTTDDSLTGPPAFHPRREESPDEVEDTPAPWESPEPENGSSFADGNDSELPSDAWVRALDGEPIPLLESPLAVTVLTGKDLRAMGIVTLPEAFRYVPGVDAFQLNGFTYAAGIRGVSNEFNPRFHVYLDGRLVNVAEFGGVDWESIPVAVDDIERIEIIRAVGLEGEAGSALEGAIRIWTKDPVEAPLATYSGYYGTMNQHVHFGRLAVTEGPFSAKASLEYRSDDGISGRQLSGLIFPPRLLEDRQDLWKLNTALGWRFSDTADLSLRFTGLYGELGETGGDPISNGPTDTQNYSIAGEFRKEWENGIRLRLGYYFEDFELQVRDHPSASLHASTSDIDLHRYTNTFYGSARAPLRPWWDLTATAGWKEDELFFDRNDPKGADQEIYHLHLGTRARPVDELILTGGLQIERDLFSGTDVSPLTGVVYRLLDDHSLRLSYRVGRRRPTFTDTMIGFVLPNPMPPPATLPLLTGNPRLDNESVQAWEAGYRGVFRDLLVDFQFYFHELRDRIAMVPDLTSPVPGALTFDNSGEERALGTELRAEWQIAGPLSLYGTYTYQDVQDVSADRALRDHPRHKVNTGLRLLFEDGPLEGVAAFLNLNYVSRIEQVDVLGVKHSLGDRFRVDFRLAKSFLDDRLEIALIGRNIFDSDTVEFRPALGSNWNGAFGSERMIFLNLLARF